MYKVLILTDFSEICFNSVTYGLDFCRHYGFLPVILHVDCSESVTKTDLYETNHVAETIRLYNKKFKLGAQLIIRKGELSEVISQEVSKGHFILVILGTHGKLGFQSVTGSAAYSIVAIQQIPVMVIQHKRFAPIQTAMLPIAGATVGDNELAKVVELATLLDTEVIVCCRPEDQEFVGKFTRSFPKVKSMVIDHDSKSPTFSRRVINFCEESDSDIIIAISSEIVGNSADTIMEQLIFNLSQIPVICC